MRGRLAMPPSARLSRTTAAARSMEPSAGSVLSTANITGCSIFSHRGPTVLTTWSMRLPGWPTMKAASTA